MASRLVYVMDPMCSWCWGFAPVLDALLAQAAAAGVPTHLVLGGLRTGQAALDPGTRARILEHWHSVEAATGQPFRFDEALPHGFVYDTEPACRAVAAARRIDEALAWPMARALAEAFYRDGRDITRTATLVDIAERTGLSRIRFAEAFDGPATLEATQADFRWSQSLGISGFPTVLCEHDRQFALLTNGYQPLGELAPLLARWLDRATAL
ncbi:DsbA family protein [Pseudomonas sp. RIT-PI-S]|uniref:DsbA family protein n=1 Tax=Pseudomonas sp. RIT-PI-S TaxID=3035295 RepID=UPI0021D99AF9|nr:DsbA family protein [Pseudomonas sp. RIT-PI-S]